MASRSAMAVLAGASLMAPAGDVMAEALAAVAWTAPDATSPAAVPQDPTVNIGATEDLTTRGDITATADTYLIRFPVTVATGSTTYIPSGNFSEALAATVRRLVVDGSPRGVWMNGWSAFAQEDATTVPWTPSSGSTIVTVEVDRAAFDAERARAGQPLSLAIGISPSPTASSTADDYYYYYW